MRWFGSIACVGLRQMIGRLQRRVVRLRLVLFGVIPSQFFAQFDDIADDNQRGRLEFSCCGKAR